MKSEMASRPLDLISCPVCGESLGFLSEGVVRCGRGHGFSSRAGYLDLSGSEDPDVTTERTFTSFGYEWNTFDDVREEDEEFAEVYFRDLDLSSLGGKVGLDAGCGKGRYTRFVAPHLECLIALDGSSAVEAAARNLAGHPNTLVVRADLRTVPIAPSRVDFVMSLGVLHHLEDPLAGLVKLSAILSPGGQMLLYLYSRPSQAGFRRSALAAARQMRKVTVRIPHRVLRVLSVPVAAVLYICVVKVGALGERSDMLRLSSLPMAGYRGKPFRSLVLDTFDRLSAPVEHRFSREELEELVRDAGLELQTAREESGWFVICHKPVPPPGPSGSPAASVTR